MEFHITGSEGGRRKRTHTTDTSPATYPTARRVRRKAAWKRPATARKRDLAAQPILLAADTTCFVMDPTRSAAVAERHFGITRADGALPEGRHLVLSSDFYSVYQSLGQTDGVDPLWCWAHIRRYFIRAGDAHDQLRLWRDQWVERIAVLYTAHRTLAATPPASPEHKAAEQGFAQALDEIDTARRQPRGPAWPATATSPTYPLDNYADGLVMPNWA